MWLSCVRLVILCIYSTDGMCHHPLNSIDGRVAWLFTSAPELAPSGKWQLHEMFHEKPTVGRLPNVNQIGEVAFW